MQGGGGHFDSRIVGIVRIVNPALFLTFLTFTKSAGGSVTCADPAEAVLMGHIYQTSMKILGPVKRSVLISLQSTHSQERFNEFRKTTEPKVCLKGEMLWKRQKLPRAK